MTDRDTLRERIELAIARNTFSRAAAAILADIETTHVLVERGRWERVAKPSRIFTAAENEGIAFDFHGKGSMRMGQSFEQAMNDIRRHPGDLEDPT